MHGTGTTPSSRDWHSKCATRPWWKTTWVDGNSLGKSIEEIVKSLFVPVYRHRLLLLLCKNVLSRNLRRPTCPESARAAQLKHIFTVAQSCAPDDANSSNGIRIMNNRWHLKLHKAPHLASLLPLTVIAPALLSVAFTTSAASPISVRATRKSSSTGITSSTTSRNMASAFFFLLTTTSVAALLV